MRLLLCFNWFCPVEKNWSETLLHLIILLTSLFMILSVTSFPGSKFCGIFSLISGILSGTLLKWQPQGTSKRRLECTLNRKTVYSEWQKSVLDLNHY